MKRNVSLNAIDWDASGERVRNSFSEKHLGRQAGRVRLYIQRIGRLAPAILRRAQTMLIWHRARSINWITFRIELLFKKRCSSRGNILRSAC